MLAEGSLLRCYVDNNISIYTDCKMQVRKNNLNAILLEKSFEKSHSLLQILFPHRM